jgi:spore photoproduct lyase
MPGAIKAASQCLGGELSLVESIAAGKRVLALVSSAGVVDEFIMRDPRMGCPRFLTLAVVSNGCPFRCAWCFLRGTYRGLFPYMAVHVRYEKIKAEIARLVAKSAGVVLVNGGELQDGLGLEHLTGAAQAFIPFFADLPNARLFLLTKSDNVDPILGLPHNGHTILGWSMNAPAISRMFEIGAPSFERRLAAARRAQQAGYPIRIRLDPIVPVSGWERIYADAIERIFTEIVPQRITLGTLRFEEQFYKNRQALIGQEESGSHLLAEMDRMVPMLPPMEVPAGKRGGDGRPQMKTSVGKYSYPETLRVKIFRFAISEIRKHFTGPVALCKETASAWAGVGLDPHRCQCVCQFDVADLSRPVPVGL